MFGRVGLIDFTENPIGKKKKKATFANERYRLLDSSEVEFNISDKLSGYKLNNCVQYWVGVADKHFLRK